MIIDENKIEETVRSYILKEYAEEGDVNITRDTPLLSSGVIDSISVMQLVDFLEKTFDFEFLPHEVYQDNLDTIEKIAAFVSNKTN